MKLSEVKSKLKELDTIAFQLPNGELVNIIELSQKVLELGDLEIEVEYQAETIGKFGLDFDGKNFLLTTKQTDCLAKDNCGIPAEKLNVKLGDMQKAVSCSPNSGCC